VHPSLALGVIVRHPYLLALTRRPRICQFGTSDARLETYHVERHCVQGGDMLRAQRHFTLCWRMLVSMAALGQACDTCNVLRIFCSTSVEQMFSLISSFSTTITVGLAFLHVDSSCVNDMEIYSDPLEFQFVFSASERCGFLVKQQRCRRTRRAFVRSVGSAFSNSSNTMFRSKWCSVRNVSVLECERFQLRSVSVRMRR